MSSATVQKVSSSAATTEDVDESIEAPSPSDAEGSEDPSKQESTPSASSSEPVENKNNARTDDQDSNQSTTRTPATAAPTPTPTPTPPPVTSSPTPRRCMGARAYDGGFFDVGSFFVFHHTLPDANILSTDAKSKRSSGKDVPGDDPVKEPAREFSKEDHEESSSRSPASLLGYKFAEGLRVHTTAVKGGKNAQGEESEGAIQAYLELRRQVEVMGQALGCVDALAEPEESDSKRTTSPISNGDQSHAKPHQEVQDEQQQCFALCNRDDNESVQGLVRSGGCLWLGTFTLPPIPQGEDEDQTIDLWPREVARFAEDGQTGIVALEGKPDAKGPLIPPKEESGGRDVIEGACAAYRLVARALAELRPYFPRAQIAVAAVAAEPPPTKTRSPDTAASNQAEGVDVDGGMSVDENNDGDDDEEEKDVVGGKRRASARGKKGRSKEAGGLGQSVAAEDSGEGSTGPRKRRRVQRGGGPPGRPSRQEEGQEQEGRGGATKREEHDGNDDNDMDNGMDNYEEEEDDEEIEFVEEGGQNEDNQDDSSEEQMGVGSGAGEMTVGAVRTSLLRNRADEDPHREAEEWEGVVRTFITHVESLSPGTTQEELSLMFAAALDPTLVRMRAANRLLVDLAEACAERITFQDEENGGHNADGANGDVRPKKGGGSTSAYDSVAAPAAAEGSNIVPRFKVHVDLDEYRSPPDGVASLLRAVSATRYAIEATARAEACVSAAGDTLGGLQDLRADYKRSLPPGPREPIQLIIGEEQARVLGYLTAHENILERRIDDLHATALDVGHVYRAVESEPGWGEVKPKVDSFLLRFEAYCASRLPKFASNPRLLGLDARASDLARRRSALHVDRP